MLSVKSKYEFKVWKHFECLKEKSCIPAFVLHMQFRMKLTINTFENITYLTKFFDQKIHLYNYSKIRSENDPIQTPGYANILTRVTHKMNSHKIREDIKLKS